MAHYTRTLSNVEPLCRVIPTKRAFFGGLTPLRVTTWAMFVFFVIFPLTMHLSSANASNVIPAGVWIGDIDAGRMSIDTARASVIDRAEAFAALGISLDLGDRQWQRSLGEVGVRLDVDASLQSAMTATGGPDALVPTSRVVPFAILYDPTVFNAWIDDILGDLGGDAVDASVRMEGVNAVVIPATSGAWIDRAALETSLLQQLTTLQPVSLSADLQNGEPAIRTSAAETAAMRTEQALAQPWVFTAGDDTWDVAPEELVPALRFVPQGDGSLALVWDANALASVMDGLANEVDVKAADAWVQDLGTKQWLVPSQEARSLDRHATVIAMQQALTQGEHEVALSLITGQEPEKSTTVVMAEMGMTGIVGEGNSFYTGSGSGRTHNVETAAYLIDGTLVAPGEVFSFNDAVGSLFSGAFTMGGSYIDGPTGESLGGGVCQVVTTVFRAALDSGFPIVEWWPHSYRTSYYELGGWSPGFDAAIVQDAGKPSESTDLRFRNTTDAWLMISAKVSNGELTVQIHGADQGYTVRYDEPVMEMLESAPSDALVVVDEQLAPGTIEESPAMDGLRVTVVRSVYDANGDLVLQDSFVSPYKPLGAIHKVSPDMAE